MFLHQNNPRGCELMLDLMVYVQLFARLSVRVYNGQLRRGRFVLPVRLSLVIYFWCIYRLEIAGFV